MKLVLLWSDILFFLLIAGRAGGASARVASAWVLRRCWRSFS